MSTECDLVDYKIHCFNGNPQFVLVCSNRFNKSGLIETFYDLDWQPISVSRPGSVADGAGNAKPLHLDEMVTMAKKLSNGIPFIRADFYEIDGQVYFGELTFFPASGYKPFIPKEYDLKFGELLDLSNIHH